MLKKKVNTMSDSADESVFLTSWLHSTTLLSLALDSKFLDLFSSKRPPLSNKRANLNKTMPLIDHPFFNSIQNNKTSQSLQAFLSCIYLLLVNLLHF